MHLFKLIIFALVLSESQCDRHQFLQRKTDRATTSNRPLEAAVTTLLSCYEKEVDTLGVAGVTDPVLQRLLMNQGLPVKILGNDKPEAAVKNQTPPLFSRHKLHLFVVEAISRPQLDRILLDLVYSHVSVALARYLIIDWQSQNSQKGCSNAAQYIFDAVWKWGILNAFYVCFDMLKEKVLVYTYNPYTYRAPKPWRLPNDTYPSRAKYYWPTFFREYQPGNRRICDNLNFDKDHDLGGVYVNTFIEVDLPIETIIRNPPRVNYFQDRFPYLSSVFKALNAKPALCEYSPQTKFGPQTVVWNHRKNTTIPAAWFDIFAEYATNLDAMISATSPRVMSAGLRVLTQYRGEMSQIDKLLGVLDKSTRYLLCLVVFVTFLFFKYFLRQPLGAATLNVVRIVANSCLVKEPQKVAPRLYLAGVFILVVTIVGIYQGVLASLLTKPKPLRDVETWEDLMDSPHEIHTLKKYAVFFTDPKFKGRLVLHGSRDCVKYVLGDPLAACVDMQRDLMLRALNYNLHVSRDVIVPMYYTYLMATNWHPQKRFNEIISLFTESHVAWYIHDRELEWKLEAAEYKAELERNRPVVMVLSNLGFAFAFLGIGLSLATVVFIFEVSIKRT